MKQWIQLAWLATLSLSGCQKPDDTTREPNMCEVHHLAMTKRAVPVAHGMIPMNREAEERGEWKRRMEFYPHPGDCRPGTDIVMPGEQKQVLVFVCPKCEAAKKELERTAP